MAVENSTVLIIVNNWGIEETELTRPLRDLKAAGAKVVKKSGDSGKTDGKDDGTQKPDRKSVV